MMTETAGQGNRQKLTKIGDSVGVSCPDSRSLAETHPLREGGRFKFAPGLKSFDTNGSSFDTRNNQIQGPGALVCLDIHFSRKESQFLRNADMQTHMTCHKRIAKSN